MSGDSGIIEMAAQSVLADPAAQVLEWGVRGLDGGVTAEVGMTGGVDQIEGTARSHGATHPWSAIRKVLQPSEIPWSTRTIPRLDPRGFEYWRREAETYSDGILDELGPRLRAPACYRVQEHVDHIELWLECVPDDGPSVWGMAEYFTASRALGHWAGTTLGSRPLPDRPWFTRSQIPGWLELGAQGIEALHAAPRRGLAEQWLPDASIERVLALWEQHPMVLAAEPPPGSRRTNSPPLTRRPAGSLALNDRQVTTAQPHWRLHQGFCTLEPGHGHEVASRGAWGPHGNN